MSTLAVVGSVLGLGVAGLDPLGALIVLPALTAGARRRIVVLFYVVALVVTVVTGLVFGQSLEYLLGWLEQVLDVSDPVRLGLQLPAGVALGVWAARRWRRRDDSATSKRTSPLAWPFAMTVAGVVWGVTALTDPSFLALTAVSVNVTHILGVAALFAAWFVVSQAPLTVVVLALATGRDSKVVKSAIALAQKSVAPAGHLLTVALTVAAALIIANAVTYLATGTYWPL